MREDDPTVGLDSPRLGRPLPKLLAEAEVARLLAAARDWPGDEGVRLLCVLELLYATGLRVSELVTLPLRRGAARSALSAGARQGRAGADGAAGRAGAPGACRLSRTARAVSCRRPTVALAVSVARRRRISDPPALRPIAEGIGREGRARPGAAVAACAAPRLRQPSARSRRRSAQRAADAGACRHRDDADLYPCHGDRLRRLVETAHPLARRK